MLKVNAFVCIVFSVRKVKSLLKCDKHDGCCDTGSWCLVTGNITCSAKDSSVFVERSAINNKDLNTSTRT
jgi:hypothetical protein